VHLVGFNIRIYHDARSPECQICNSVFINHKTIHLTGTCRYLLFYIIHSPTCFGSNCTIIK